MQIPNSLPSSVLPSQVKPNEKTSETASQSAVSVNSAIENARQVNVNQEAKSRAKQNNRLSADRASLDLVVKQALYEEKQRNTAYDQPSKQNHLAVAAYQKVNNQAKREQIQQTFGVDFFV